MLSLLNHAYKIQLLPNIIGLFTTGVLYAYASLHALILHLGLNNPLPHFNVSGSLSLIHLSVNVELWTYVTFLLADFRSKCPPVSAFWKNDWTSELLRYLFSRNAGSVKEMRGANSTECPSNSPKMSSVKTYFLNLQPKRRAQWSFHNQKSSVYFLFRSWAEENHVVLRVFPSSLLPRGGEYS